MVYLGDNILNKFTDAAYLIAEKTFIKETSIIGETQKQLLYEFSIISRNSLYLMNKLLINANHTVSQSQAQLMKSYITSSNLNMTAQSFPEATTDVYSSAFINQAFQLFTIIPLLSFDQGISQSISLIINGNFVIVYPADALPSNYNLQEQIWHYQLMQGFQNLTKASIDVKLAFKSVGLATLQLGLKTTATSVPCFDKQGLLIGSLMYETSTLLVQYLAEKYRNTEYTQYVVLNTGLLLFAKLNDSNYQYFQNSSITGFEQWDWADIITNNYKNNTCTTLQTIKLLCKYNSLYKQDSYVKATYLPTEELYIISVITEQYLEYSISIETDFVAEQLNFIIYQYLTQLTIISLLIIIITIIAIRIIFQPIQHILEDVSYSIFSGRLDMFRRIRNASNGEIKDAENCLQLLSLSYNKHKSEDKSFECILIEDRNEYYARTHDISLLLAYCQNEFQQISDQQKRFTQLFHVLILSVKILIIIQPLIFQMVLGGRFQNWRIGTQICIFVTSILLLSIPLSCVPMVYLGDNMLNQFSDASYIIAEKTFVKQTNIIGSMQQELLYDQKYSIFDEQVTNKFQSYSQSQALLMSNYLTQYRLQNYSMATKSLPGAVIDIRTVSAANQVFYISTIIPLLSLEQGISQSIQLVLRNSVLVVYPANTMPSNYNLSQQIWYLQFMQGYQKIANSSIDTKLAFKITGLETLQMGLKAFATTVPCFSQQGALIGALMYETKTSIIKELVERYRNTEYTQYIVLNTGLLIFAEQNSSNFQYFQNSSITGFDQWDWADIITNNYANSTCVSLQTSQLLCKYNSVYKQDSYIQATYLHIQQIYIISVITDDYLQKQISIETNFVNSKLNEIIYRYLGELAAISLLIIIITIIVIRLIFQPLQNILEDVSYSIFSGRLDIFRRMRNLSSQLVKEAENFFQLLSQSYYRHKNKGKSNQCNLIENREEYYERTHNTQLLLLYCQDQFQKISDDQKRYIIFFQVLSLSVN